MGLYLLRSLVRSPRGFVAEIMADENAPFRKCRPVPPEGYGWGAESTICRDPRAFVGGCLSWWTSICARGSALLISARPPPHRCSVIMPSARMSSLVNLYTGNQIHELAQTPLLMPAQSRRLGEQAVDHARSLAPLRTDASSKEAGARGRARATSRNDIRNHQCKFIATGHLSVPFLVPFWLL